MTWQNVLVYVFVYLCKLTRRSGWLYSKLIQCQLEYCEARLAGNASSTANHACIQWISGSLSRMHRQMLGYTEPVLWGTTIGSFYNAIVVQPQTLQSHCLSPYCCMTSNLKFTVQGWMVHTHEWFIATIQLSTTQMGQNLPDNQRQPSGVVRQWISEGHCSWWLPRHSYHHAMHTKLDGCTIQWMSGIRDCSGYAQQFPLFLIYCLFPSVQSMNHRLSMLNASFCLLSMLSQHFMLLHFARSKDSNLRLITSTLPQGMPSKTSNQHNGQFCSHHSSLILQYTAECSDLAKKSLSKSCWPWP